MGDMAPTGDLYGDEVEAGFEPPALSELSRGEPATAPGLLVEARARWAPGPTAGLDLHHDEVGGGASQEI